MGKECSMREVDPCGHISLKLCSQHFKPQSASTEQVKLRLRADAIPTLFAFPELLRKVCRAYSVSSLLKFGFTFEGIFCAHLLFYYI